MKRFLFVFLAPIAGCGSGVGETAADPPSARDLITPAVRSACTAITEDSIATYIVPAEGLRDTGATLAYTLSAATAACEPGGGWADSCSLLCPDDPVCYQIICIPQCHQCLTAIVDMLYRR